MSEKLSTIMSNEVFVYPTETSYGLGCDARNSTSVKRIVKIKKRPQEKTFSVIVPNLEVAQRFVYLSPQAQLLVSDHWPGPLTIVANARDKAKEKLSKYIVAKDGSIALRVSSHPIAKKLCKEIDGPIVASSANPAGSAPAFTIQKAKEYFGDSVDMYFDGGDLVSVPASTIVDVRGNELIVLRQGVIKILQKV